MNSCNQVGQEATGQTGSLGHNVKLKKLPVSLFVSGLANRKELWRARKTSLTSLHHTHITFSQRNITLCNRKHYQFNILGHLNASV